MESLLDVLQISREVRDRIKCLHTQKGRLVGSMQRKVVEVLHVRHVARYMQALTIKDSQKFLATPGHLKHVICRILRTLRKKMTQNRLIHKKGCRMRKGFLKMTPKYSDF